MPIKDLKNQRFGRLLVIYPTEKRSKKGQIYWLCQCDCKNLIEVRSSNLISGNTKSCGCLQKELHIKLNLKHGDTIKGKRPRLYRIWAGIKTRCLDSNSPNYKCIGRRGIFICEDWKNNYQAFKFWALLNGYEKHLTIDRIDNDGSYIPDNCQWITRSENSKKPKHKKQNEFKED